MGAFITSKLLLSFNTKIFIFILGEKKGQWKSAFLPGGAVKALAVIYGLACIMGTSLLVYNNIHKVAEQLNKCVN